MKKVVVTYRLGKMFVYMRSTFGKSTVNAFLENQGNNLHNI